MQEKIKLNQLEVTSFVTALVGEQQEMVRGGDPSNRTFCCTPPVYPTERNCLTLPLKDCIA